MKTHADEKTFEGYVQSLREEAIQFFELRNKLIEMEDDLGEKLRSLNLAIPEEYEIHRWVKKCEDPCLETTLESPRRSGRFEPLLIGVGHLERWILRPESIIAEGYGITEEEAKYWIKNSSDGSSFVGMIPCSYKGCLNGKNLYCDSPAKIPKSRKRAQTGIFVCHHHREKMWNNDGVLSDEMSFCLSMVVEDPGKPMSNYSLGRKDIEFLSYCGLIRIEEIHRGKNYPIVLVFPTETASQFVNKRGANEACS